MKVSGKDLFESSARPYAFDYRLRSDQPFDGYYHSHQAAELLFVHRGRGKVVVRERTYELKAGTLFFFQPDQLHRVHADIEADAPYERTILHFLPFMLEEPLRAFPELHRFFMQLSQGRLAQQAFELGEQQELLEQLLRYFADALGGAAGWQSEAGTLFLAQLMQLVRTRAELTASGGCAVPGGSGSARHSERIMKWINAHYRDKFELEELAEAMHLSKFHLSRVFRTETGSSITEYLIARRLKEACQLLRATSFPIEMIGMEVGIGNASYFSQLFRKQIGVTPHEYRMRK
ncbi:AraC family transcriptional regulator [Paenibacillus silvisoli]|uniref:AraC family transcriptional regulator n=1 Tax=Paenibacillus silvisoli TaxID=3110539 RepID=UPI0028048581|nr:AraC family transcriptional regulator [Paenibacillus silvisoli]